MGRVFVLDTRARHGLAAVRSLGRRGHAVTAGAAGRAGAGLLSKYVARRVRYPDPGDDPAAFRAAVARELERREYDLLLPINQRTVEAVMAERERFAALAALPFPPTDVLDVGLDKAKTIEAAREAGVAHPESVIAERPDLDAAADRLGYPVVVKPRRGSSRAGVAVCRSRAELEREYTAAVERHGPVVLQEFVPRADERGVYTLYDGDGELVRVTVQRRLRSQPPAGGASTYRETVADPDLVAAADRLLSTTGWRDGVAMAEYRVDAETGEPLLMEVNPRLWGSLALSIFAGVDFPADLYRQATGERLTPDLDYAVGVRARDVFTDARQVFERDDRAAAIGEFLRPSPVPCRFDVLSLDDPLPAVGHALYYAGHLARRLGGTPTDTPVASARGVEPPAEVSR